MQTDRGTHPGDRSWTLLLSPGPRLEECFPLLRILADTTPGTPPAELERLEEWPDLFCAFPGNGRIVIDTSTFAREQRDLLAAFLRHHPGWEVVLVGAAGDPGLLAELAAMPGARWAPGPLEPATLRGWLEAPSALHAAQPLPGGGPETPVLGGEAPPPTPSAPEPPRELAPAGSAQPEPDPGPEPTALHLEDEEALLQEVERILSGEADAEPPRARRTDDGASAARSPERAAVALEEEPAASEDDPFSLEMEAVPTPAGRTTAAPAPTREATQVRSSVSPAPPAPYFRHQVADLADLVQCVDLTLDVARREAAEADEPLPPRVAERLDEVGVEVARLRQYTRTLGFLVAPPALGDQRLDLAPLLEEMLTARRSEAESPRYLLRAPDPLPLRSDKLVLTQALDALLFLAHHAAGPGGTVRVDARLLEDPDEERREAQVSIRFPAGRFRGRAPGALLEPYSLRRDLPELGANALAAACSLLRGQGGRTELRVDGAEGLEWLVTLPLQG
jgi:hypothetical protein